MKPNFLLLLAGALAMTAVASAATITCAPTNLPVDTNGIPAAGTVNCPAVTATPGFVITGATFTVAFTWQDTNSATTTALMSTITQNSAQIGAGAGPFVATAALAASSGNTRLGAGSTTSGTGAVASLTSLNAFTVNIGAPTSTPGSTFPANGTITITLNTVETAVGPVPEPTTMFLFGSGLLALGLAGTRQKRKMVR